LIRNHSAHFQCWDKPQATLDSPNSPRPGFGGSHHLPPYSILYSSPPHLHPNGSFSRDSQSGVPKLSRFGLPRLWAFIISRPKFGSGWGLNQSCSSPWELSKGVSHSPYTHRDWVDSRLLVVRSQTTSLTPGPSFDHNLCCKCPNGSCEAILDIYTSRPFQRYKERFNARCFDPCNHALNFWESRGTPKSHFRECEWRPHTSFKMGLRHVHIHIQKWVLTKVTSSQDVNKLLLTTHQSWWLWALLSAWYLPYPNHHFYKTCLNSTRHFT